MNDKLRDDKLDSLFEAILSLDSVEECYAFFDDLCSVTELKAFGQRYEVARMLYDGHVYNDVVKNTGASTATISRVNRCLNYGSDGYKTAIARRKDKAAE